MIPVEEMQEGKILKFYERLPETTPDGRKCFDSFAVNVSPAPAKDKQLMECVWGYNEYSVALTERRKKYLLDRIRHEEGL